MRSSLAVVCSARAGDRVKRKMGAATTANHLQPLWHIGSMQLFTIIQSSVVLEIQRPLFCSVTDVTFFFATYEYYTIKSKYHPFQMKFALKLC
jgi:hypothetical protein